jgi:hypothetical protein
MNHLVDACQLVAAPLQQHLPGTLVMMSTHTSSSAGPFWGLMFAGSDDEGETVNVMWLNGMPWNGADPAFYGMAVNRHQVGDWLALGCGGARIEIDLSSGLGRARDEMRWDQSMGFIVATTRGRFLMGERPGRQSIIKGYHAVDLTAWIDTPNAHDDKAAEWFSRWNVVVETPRVPLTLPFDARAKAAARTP